jgi:hypothetical protein
VNIDISKALMALLGGEPEIKRDWSGPYITYVRHPHQVGVRKSGTSTYADILITPAKPQAKAFADALCELLAARVKMESRPDEYDPNTEELYERAADKLWDVLQGNFEQVQPK